MKNERFWEIANYIGLGLLIIGQIVIGWSFWIGQASFLVANIIYTLRCFLLEVPTSEKTKNSVMLAITVGLMIIKGVQSF